jgi:DNA repair protein RecN (Recombination protein N)
MLQRLWIHSFLLIESLDIHLGTGLHVLTGETGAGKSLLLDAIACLMGQRTEAKYIRTGALYAEVGAVFTPPYPAACTAWLVEQGFDAEEELWIRRVIDQNGKSKVWINQKPMPLGALKQCMGELIEIGHQHLHLKWLKSDVQRQWLDELGGLYPLTQAVKQAWEHWQQAQLRLVEARASAQQRHYEQEKLTQRQQDLDSLQPTEHAWDEMNQLHARIAGAAERQERMSRVREVLNDGKDALLYRVHHLMQELAPVIDQSEAAQSAWSLLEQAHIHLQEAVHSLKEGYEDHDRVDLVELEERIAKWHRLAKRYQIMPSEIYACWQNGKAELAHLETLLLTDVLEAEIEQAQEAYNTKAQALCSARRVVADQAEQAIAVWLPRLNLPDARFTIALHPLEEAKSYGTEQVVMQFQSHPGLACSPLAETASGGELARIALVLALIQHQEQCPPIRFFDEVDTGISGATVAEVGRLLQHQVKEGQIICISHQPQMAACADTQWKIEKRGEVLPMTTIRELTEEERHAEIARLMASSNEDSQSAIHHAQRLRQQLARLAHQEAIQISLL